MVFTIGAEIPASSESRFIYAVNKASSEGRQGWGFHAPPQGHRPEDLGPQQIGKSQFIHAVNEANSECNLHWWEERNVKTRSEATLRVNE